MILVLQDLLGSASSAQVAEGMALHTIKVAASVSESKNPKNRARQIIFFFFISASDNLISGSRVADPGLQRHQRGRCAGWDGVGCQ